MGYNGKTLGPRELGVGPGTLENLAKTKRHQERSHSPEIRSGRLTLLPVITQVGQKPHSACRAKSLKQKPSPDCRTSGGGGGVAGEGWHLWEEHGRRCVSGFTALGSNSQS